MYERHYQQREIQWCRYSDHAHDHLRPTKPYRIGRLLRKGFREVTPYSNGRPYAIVHWNGLKAPTTYHADFIEVFATTPIKTFDVPSLPVIPHLLRSFAWHA